MKIERAKSGEDNCGSKHRGYICTRKKGHTGMHVAHDFISEVHRWKQKKKV